MYSLSEVLMIRQLRTQTSGKKWPNWTGILYID